MSTLRVTHPTKKIYADISLPSSKSISNRALILQSLNHSKVELKNISTADDTSIMQQALAGNKETVYLKNAGTCMRFLTAFYACTPCEVELHGEERMYKRPIKILVDALRLLGASITYLGEEGFPPLKIKGKQLDGGKISMDASLSSQYSTALMLIAPLLKKDLEIELTGKINSRSYIEMTTQLMIDFGFDVSFHQNTITVSPPLNKLSNHQIIYTIEPDWSAASYWYEIAALSNNCEILLRGLTKNSLQGDFIIAEYMKAFGVETTFTIEGVLLTKDSSSSNLSSLTFDLNNTPDIAPTLAVTAAAKNITLELTGLQNLRIKESDRLDVLEMELKKCGFDVLVKNDALLINRRPEDKIKTTSIETHNDHRIAMAFAPLGLLEPITIENPEVVAKSYPHFWDDLQLAGFIFH